MKVREITRSVNKQIVVVWYETVPSGHRFKEISTGFKLDGVRYDPGSFIVKERDAPYGVAMTAEAFTAWCGRADVR